MSPQKEIREQAEKDLNQLKTLPVSQSCPCYVAWMRQKHHMGRGWIGLGWRNAKSSPFPAIQYSPSVSVGEKTASQCHSQSFSIWEGQCGSCWHRTSTTEPPYPFRSWTDCRFHQRCTCRQSSLWWRYSPSSCTWPDSRCRSPDFQRVRLLNRGWMGCSDARTCPPEGRSSVGIWRLGTPQNHWRVDFSTGHSDTCSPISRSYQVSNDSFYPSVQHPWSWAYCNRWRSRHTSDCSVPPCMTGKFPQTCYSQTDHHLRHPSSRCAWEDQFRSNSQIGIVSVYPWPPDWQPVPSQSTPETGEAASES